MNQPLDETLNELLCGSKQMWEEEAHEAKLQDQQVKLPLMNNAQADTSAHSAPFKGKPITDFEAFMASIPHFQGTEEEYAAFERAIAEERAERRHAAQERKE